MPLSDRGIRKDRLKSNNVYAILSLLYKNGPMPRKDIAEAIRLTPATVTMLTNELMQYGLLVEGGEVTDSSRAGRRKILIDINYHFGCIAGIYIEHNSAVVSLTYINGSLIAKRDLVIYDGADPEKFADRVSDAVGEMMSEAGILRAKLLCAGISVVGYVDSLHGISENSFGLFSDNVDMRGIFAKRLGVPVTVDNNVRALAVAEIDYNRSGQKINGLFIKHSPGLGGAVIINNHVYCGAHYRSGELGHFTVDPGGKKCACGKRGCVSTIVSRSALIGKATDILDPDTTPALWRLCKGEPCRIDIDMLTLSAHDGDRPIYKIMDTAALELAIVIENSMELVDGDIVITFGRLLNDEYFHQKIEQKLRYISDNEITYKFRKSLIGDDELWKASVAIAARELIRLLSENTNGVKKYEM